MFEDFKQDFEAIRDDLQSLASESNGWLDMHDLMGCCAIAAQWVSEYLSSHGIGVQVVHNEYHFWCRCCGQTIDLTASQFGMDAIYIAPVSEESKLDHYQNPIVVGKLTPEYMAQIRWPEEQNPFSYQ